MQQLWTRKKEVRCITWFLHNFPYYISSVHPLMAWYSPNSWIKEVIHIFCDPSVSSNNQVVKSGYESNSLLLKSMLQKFTNRHIQANSGQNFTEMELQVSQAFRNSQNPEFYQLNAYFTHLLLKQSSQLTSNCPL